MTDHQPQVVEENDHYRMGCNCGMSGVTWIERRNAERDVKSHAERDQRRAAEAERQGGAG